MYHMKRTTIRYATCRGAVENHFDGNFDLLWPIIGACEAKKPFHTVHAIVVNDETTHLPVRLPMAHCKWHDPCARVLRLCRLPTLKTSPPMGVALHMDPPLCMWDHSKAVWTHSAGYAVFSELIQSHKISAGLLVVCLWYWATRPLNLHDNPPQFCTAQSRKEEGWKVMNQTWMLNRNGQAVFIMSLPSVNPPPHYAAGNSSLLSGSGFS